MSKNSVLLIVFFQLLFSTWYVASDQYKIKVPPLVEHRLHYPTVGRVVVVEMLEALIRDGEKSIIGLYGESDIGKTAVLRDLHKKFESDALGFDRIIWVTVTKPVNISEIIDEIGSRVLNEYPKEASWRSESQNIKTGRIFAKLSREKFLLILDGVPNFIELITIGVPTPDPENGSKVLLSCRSSKVCRYMRAQRLVELEPLSQEDAWTLFCENAFCDVDNHCLADPEIYKLAKTICAQCCGVPKKLIDAGLNMACATTVAEWKKCLEKPKTFHWC